MKTDASKIIELRNSKAMNQEALAGAAKVSVRTVQRAEAGKAIDLQSAQQIASALKVQPAAIRAAEHDEVQPSSELNGSELVRLRSIATARELLVAIASCDACRLDHVVDIRQEALNTVVSFYEALEPELPVLCPEITSWDGSDSNPAASPIARIKCEVQLNELLLELEKASIGVYVGTYVDYQQRPRYDIDEGCWATRINQRLEAIKYGIVRLGPFGLPQLSERVQINSPIPF